MLRLLWPVTRTTNQSQIRSKFKKRLGTKITEKISKFVGHVIRRDRIERLTIERSTRVKKSSRRSPTKYTDITAKLTGNKLTYSVRDAENRDLGRIRTNDIP